MIPPETIARVTAEKADLDDRRMRLNGFIGSPEFAETTHGHRRLLREQLSAMTRYSSILAERLDLFAATKD